MIAAPVLVAAALLIFRGEEAGQRRDEGQPLPEGPEAPEDVEFEVSAWAKVPKEQIEAADKLKLPVAGEVRREKTAQLLAELGLDVQPFAEDEGGVDRYVSKRLGGDRRAADGFLSGIMDMTLLTSAINLLNTPGR